jgi:membrane-associated phospholipid phosphatase
MRAVLILFFLVSTANANPDPWYKGRYGRNRIVHLTIASGGSLLYIATGRLETQLSPDPCRWCTTNSIDRNVADALKWKHPDNANVTSHITTYVLTPAVTTGLVFFGTPGNTAAVIDDLVPIAESLTLARWASRISKLVIGRERPDMSDNVSFPSGHTTTAFSVAVSAGMVAHMRGYKVEPYVWASGLLLATTSGYLRIAANKHWLTDTLGGAFLGTAIGLTVPLLMQRQVEFTASRESLAIGGVW